MICLVNDKRNMITRLVVFITLLIILSANNGLCETYKWRSDDGSISFTDDLRKIPEKYRDQVEVMKFKSDEPELSGNSTMREDTNILTDKDIEKDRKELPEDE